MANSFRKNEARHWAIQRSYSLTKVIGDIVFVFFRRVSGFVQQPRETGVAETTPLDISEDEILDRAALHNIRSLQAEGAEDILTRIIDLYLNEAPGQLEQLQKALHKRDATAVRSVAHSLKSSSANLGATVLSSLLKELEEKGRNNSLMGARELFSRIKTEFTKAKVQLQKEKTEDEIC